MAPVEDTTKASTIKVFRGSLAWLSGWLPMLRSGGYPTPRKARFQVLVRLFWTGFYPQDPYKGFQISVLSIFLPFQTS